MIHCNSNATQFKKLTKIYKIGYFQK